MWAATDYLQIRLCKSGADILLLSKDIDDIKKNIVPCSFPVLHQHLYDLDLKFKQKTEASSELSGTDEM